MVKSFIERHQDFFTEKGAGFFTRKNIYNKNGMLLLREGQKVSESTILKLLRLESCGLEIMNEDNSVGMRGFAIASKEMAKDIQIPNTEEFEKKLNIRNKLVLEKPNKLLSDIIFESKGEPWWIYINALPNYVNWIYTHSIDVAIISMMLAERLGYTDEELFNIGLAALLHDVGKLLVPKAIIEKPEALNEVEKDCMRQHCELGLSSLETFNIPKEFTDIIMQHHERLDGSGYPNGLKGDEISHIAQIAMVADTIDAITSHRPYREAYDIKTAIKMLRKERARYPQELITLFENIIYEE